MELWSLEDSGRLSVSSPVVPQLTKRRVITGMSDFLYLWLSFRRIGLQHSYIAVASMTAEAHKCILFSLLDRKVGFNRRSRPCGKSVATLILG